VDVTRDQAQRQDIMVWGRDSGNCGLTHSEAEAVRIVIVQGLEAPHHHITGQDLQQCKLL